MSLFLPEHGNVQPWAGEEELIKELTYKAGGEFIGAAAFLDYALLPDMSAASSKITWRSFPDGTYTVQDRHITQLLERYEDKIAEAQACALGIADQIPQELVRATATRGREFLLATSGHLAVRALVDSFAASPVDEPLF